MAYRSNYRSGSGQTGSVYQRRFISPNELKGQSAATQEGGKDPRLAEYGSLDHEKGSHRGSQLSANSKNEKSKSQLSQQSGREESRDRKPQGKQISSRSKEKKDYMTANLAKFNRKKDEKKEDKKSQDSPTLPAAPPPTTAQRTPPQPPASQTTPFKPQAITFKSPPPHPADKQPPPPPPAAKLPSPLQLSIESNSQQLLPSRLRTTPIEVNVVRHREHSRGYEEQESNRHSRKDMENSNWSSPNDPSEPPRLPSSSGLSSVEKLQLESSRQGERKYIQELVGKLKAEREESNVRLRRVEGEKAELQERNSKLIELQYHLQNEVELARTRNAQLQREVETARDMVARGNRENTRAMDAQQGNIKELEERYNSLAATYREQGRQAADQARKMGELEALLADERERARLLELEVAGRDIEMERMRKLYEGRLQEVKQSAEYQLKEQQIRVGNRQQQESILEANLKQVEREVAAKERELEARSRQVSDLQDQVRQMEELKAVLEGKVKENDRLVGELNENKNQLLSLSEDYSQKMQAKEVELRQLEKEHHQLAISHSSLQTQLHTNQLADHSRTETFSHADSRSSFELMLQGQSQETNKLRTELFAANEQIYLLQTANEQLSDRLRRTEQQTQLAQRTYESNLRSLKEAKEAMEVVGKSEGEALRRKVAALEGKVRDREGEIEQRNRFIEKFLMGSNKKEEAGVLLQQLQQILRK